MKTYRVCMYAIDGGSFDADKAHLTDIIEFTLTSPHDGSVFSILAQWQAQAKALDAEESAKGEGANAPV